ncbi:MAG: hypothetical protein WC659_03290 [Patescibacteria group bacterium]
MITNFKRLVQTKGSSYLSPAHGKGGARATILFLLDPPPEKSAGGFQQVGKKEGGWGEGIFAHLLSAPKARLRWERLRSLAPSREAKQNIFQFLLEEKGSRTKIEKREKCFASRRRQAGGAAGRVSFVQSRFALRSVIATKLDIDSFRKKVRARFARALGGFYSDFPPQSAIRPTNPSRLFWRAGGGSGARSAQQMKFVSNFFLSAKGGIRSQFFNPALYGQRRLTI